jgi:hypothetical protein
MTVSNIKFGMGWLNQRGALKGGKEGLKEHLIRSKANQRKLRGKQSQQLDVGLAVREARDSSH